MDGRKPLSRRFFYLVPAEGEPIKLVHRIESGALDHLPGSKRIYLRWKELEDGVAAWSRGKARLAMEYSPRNANPYISRVDAGTIELVRASGAEVVPSGDLIQRFEATWDDDQWAMHREAAEVCRSAYDVAFGLIAERARSGGSVMETEVQKAILDHFRAHGLTTDGPPIVGVGPHSGDPHYETSPETDAPIGPGDFVLVDLWAKVNKPRGVYADYTRVGYVGEAVPEKYEDVFAVIVRGRDAGLALVREAFAAGRPLKGGEVDDATRRVVEAAGYGEAFGHRTGHNIGHGRPRQRRPPRQPGDPGRPAPDPPDLLLDRAGDLPARVRRPDRDRRLHRRRRRGPRHRRRAPDLRPAHPRLTSWSPPPDGVDRPASPG